MKTTRALVLVSNDPVSIKCGSVDVFQALQTEIRLHHLQEEIKISTISNIALLIDLPLVMIYPEGVVYGPIRVDDVQVLVQEHLMQGRIVQRLAGRMHEPVGDI